MDLRTLAPSFPHTLLCAALAVTSCSMSNCELVCSRNADCIEQELADFGSTWPDWTGFADRAAYEAECLGTYEASNEEGTSKKRLQKTCALALETDACPSR